MKNIEARRLATSLAFIACDTPGPKGVTALAIESETMLDQPIPRPRFIIRVTRNKPITSGDIYSVGQRGSQKLGELLRHCQRISSEKRQLELYWLSCQKRRLKRIKDAALNT